jgi:hypothetical protein
MDHDTEREPRQLSAGELAGLAGVAEAEVGRMVALGVLVARDGDGRFRATDVQKVRLAEACEQAGLPLEGIGAAIRAGRLSFAFLEASPYRRWAVRSARTYRQVSEQARVPLELLRAALEAMGFARTAPDEPMREDELEVVPVLQLVHASGVLDQTWMTRLGRPTPRACGWPPGSRPRPTTRASSCRCWSPAPTSGRPWRSPPSSPAGSTR